jgi:hypothetical protein
MVEARAHGQYGKTVEAIDEQPINGVCFLTLWCARALVRGPTDIYPLLAKYSTIVSHNGIHTVPLSTLVPGRQEFGRPKELCALCAKEACFALKESH